MRKYHYLSEHSDPAVEADIQWYAQYGRPRQAGFYPQLAKLRRACERRLVAAGINLLDFNGDSENEKDGWVNATQLFHKYGRTWRPATRAAHLEREAQEWE